MNSLDELLNAISSVSNCVANNDLDRLVIEEELLVMLIKHPSQSLKMKKEALTRVKEINRRQLEILGERL